MTEDKYQPKIGGLILAGGQGQRVNKQNKGLLLLHNKPLIKHLIETLTPQLDYLAISANRQLATYQAFNLPVFTDDNTWQTMGPLAGIISSCQFFPNDLEGILVTPCDTPFLPNNLLQQLSHALYSKPENEVAYAATSQCIHPSVFLFKPSINNNLAQHINAGKRSLKSWLFAHKAVEVFFEDENTFININDLSTLNSLNKGDGK